MPDLQIIFSGHRRPWLRFVDADAPANSPPIRGQIQHKPGASRKSVNLKNGRVQCLEVSRTPVRL
ncbi:hypothetical protein NEUTE2DRAFT_56148 [Neurospora tetrasperma FGSC 2509]|nr:hypothetical protein NEUTE2DRAFT_56148 [Neurospora tetrasperma FGSC 2509]